MRNLMKGLPKSLIQASGTAMTSNMEDAIVVRQDLAETLKGDQYKLDVHRDGKLTAKDFKKLRNSKKINEALDRGVHRSNIVELRTPGAPQIHGMIGEVLRVNRLKKEAMIQVEGKVYHVKNGSYVPVSEELIDEAKKMKGEDPCWDSHEMIGHKMKNGKKVPNCVPKEEVEYEEDSLEESVKYLDEGKISYSHYTITSGPKMSSAGEGRPDHVEGVSKKLKTLGIEHTKGKDYGTTRRVTVVNNKTGETTDHHVYQSEWGHNKTKPLVSVRHVGKTNSAHTAHHNVLKNYLTGKPTIKEEVELQELSKDTLKSYHKKAEAQVQGTVKRGRISNAAKQLRVKRGAGLEAVKAKLQKIHKKESEEYSKRVHSANEEIDTHFMDNHHDVMKKHGFELVNTGMHNSLRGDDTHDHVKTYVQHHPNGHSSMVSIVARGDKGNRNTGHGIEVKSVNSKGTSWSTHYPNRGYWGHTAKNETDHKAAISQHKNEMMAPFEKHVIDLKQAGAKDGSW